MPSNLSSLANKNYAKKFIEGADRAPSKLDTEEAEKLMRLNVEIPASLHQDLKQLAVSESTTVRKLVIAALETSVKKLKKKPAASQD